MTGASSSFVYDPTAPACEASLVDEVADLARAAGDVTLKWFRTAELSTDHKSDGTPVTVADRAAERLIRERLAATRPDDAVIGEEEATTPGTSERTWIIDPIDGTKAFTHGVPLYSVLVAVADEHGLAAGAIGLPALDELVWAGRGRGCHTNRGVTGVDSARMAHGREGHGGGPLGGVWVMTSGIGHWPAGSLDRLHAAGASVRTWGDGFGYAMVATGRAHVMVDPQAELYDLAPMPVVIGEAGGVFSDWAGAPAGADGGSAVAAADVEIHRLVIDALQG